MLLLFTFPHYLSSVGHSAGIRNPLKKQEHGELCQKDISTPTWHCESSSSSTNKSEKPLWGLIFCFPQVFEMSCVFFNGTQGLLQFGPNLLFQSHCEILIQNYWHYVPGTVLDTGDIKVNSLQLMSQSPSIPWTSFTFPCLCFCGSFV